MNEQEEFEFRLRLEQEQAPVEKEKSNYSQVNPLGLDPMSGVVGAKLPDLATGAKETGLGLVEGATGGIPRIIAEKVTGDDLSGYRGNIAGQLGGFMAGPAKLATGAGKAVAKKLVPEAFKTGGRLATARNASKVASIVPNAIKAGAVEGGVGGVLGGVMFPQDDLDLKKRAYSALVGGVIGAPLGAITSGVGGFLKAKQLVTSAKKVGEKLDKINARMPYERPTAGEIFPVKNPKEYALAEKIRLEQLNKETTNLLASETDEANNVIKEVIPKWERANYESYGRGLDEISAEMAKSGKTIKASQLSDELNTYLKSRGLAYTEAPYGQPATSPSDRAMVKWANELLNYRKNSGDLSEKGTDAVLELKDVLTRMRAVKKTVPSNVLAGKKPMTPEVSGGRKMDEILGNLLDDGSNVKLQELKSGYAEFADLRDFARAKFDINSEYSTKAGQEILQKFAKSSGKSMADLALDRGTVAKLEALEKEVGVPFLEKLRKYGSNFDELENNVRLLEEKAKRTGVVVDAIKTRNQESIRGIMDKLKVPETLTRQLATAAYAYLLSRTLSKAIGRRD